jgi:hypothetical protein
MEDNKSAMEHRMFDMERKLEDAARAYRRLEARTERLETMYRERLHSGGAKLSIELRDTSPPMKKQPIRGVVLERAPFCSTNRGVPCRNDPDCPVHGPRNPFCPYGLPTCLNSDCVEGRKEGYVGKH